jgi:hypothetical protein
MIGQSGRDGETTWAGLGFGRRQTGILSVSDRTEEVGQAFLLPLGTYLVFLPLQVV